MSDDRITINVDGVDHEVGRNQPLIEAIREAGVDTPNFCYHPDLAIAGNCRVCLVEVDGPRGAMLGISCHMRPMPGMKVRTQHSSEKVVEARKGVMEFLLVNHPLDCPICDKAGECMLQEHYMGSGQHESRLEDTVGKVYKGGVDHRFIDSKGQERGGKKIDLGPSIILDQERCILCSRCVRFMRDVAGEEQLYIAGRGDTAYLTTFPGDDLNHEYDLCTTDVCPVGALTGKHFRFQQRVWFLKQTPSIAPDDSLGANITVDHSNGQAYRIMPRRNPDVNKSWLHNDTRLLYQDLHENRLTESIIADKPGTLTAGLKAIGDGLRASDKIAVVTSGHLTNEDNVAIKALSEALGADLYFGSWLPIGEADGIARSGDPVANRRGCEDLGLENNLDQLITRAGDYQSLVVFGHDLWGIDSAKAEQLKVIANRYVISAHQDDSVKQATVALGMRAWAEVRGTMTNCHGRVQMMQAAPICPNDDLEAAWQIAGRLSVLAKDKALPLTSENSCWKAYQQAVPAAEAISYRLIGPMGAQLPELVEAGVEVGAETGESEQ